MKKQVKAAKAPKSRASDDKVEPSSGNVFADLGFRDAESKVLDQDRSIDRAKRLDPNADRSAHRPGPVQNIASCGGRLFSGPLFAIPDTVQVGGSNPPRLLYPEHCQVFTPN